MNRRPIVSTLVVFLVFAAATFAQVSSQSLPNGLLAVEGSTSSAYPWATTAPNAWHWNYDTSNFVVAQPITITALYVRANGGGNAVGGTHPNVEVTFASSLVDWSATASGTVLANVMHTDAALVYSGPFTMPAGLQTTPAAWVPLGPITPFYYDPTAGKDFIIQVRTHGPNSAIMAAVDLHANGSAQRYGSQTSSTITTANFANVNIVPVVKIDYTTCISNCPPAPCALTFSSPNGPGSIQMDHGACPPVAGAAYLVAFTFAQGAYPNGWWYGLDIDIPSLFNWYNAGYPFIGGLDGVGAASFGPTPGGYLPSGFQFWSVSTIWSPTYSQFLLAYPKKTYTIP